MIAVGCTGAFGRGRPSASCTRARHQRPYRVVRVGERNALGRFCYFSTLLFVRHFLVAFFFVQLQNGRVSVVCLDMFALFVVDKTYSGVYARRARNAFHPIDAVRHSQGRCSAGRSSWTATAAASSAPLYHLGTVAEFPRPAVIVADPLRDFRDQIFPCDDNTPAGPPSEPLPVVVQRTRRVSNLQPVVVVFPNPYRFCFFFFLLLFCYFRDERWPMFDAMTDTKRRVKLYALNADRQWDDRGTGHVSCTYVERLKGVSLLVRAEADGEY